MTELLVTVVAGGAELDRVTLNDEGRLSYQTGAAEDLFESRRRTLGSESDTDLVDAMTGWSNGYIAVRAAGDEQQRG